MSVSSADYKIKRRSHRERNHNSHEYLRPHGLPYRETLQGKMEHRNLLQDHQAESQDQEVLRKNRERREDADLDCTYNLSSVSETAPDERNAAKNFTHFVCELSVCLFQRKDLFGWFARIPPGKHPAVNCLQPELDLSRMFFKNSFLKKI